MHKCSLIGQQTSKLESKPAKPGPPTRAAFARGGVGSWPNSSSPTAQAAGEHRADGPASCLDRVTMDRLNEVANLFNISSGLVCRDFKDVDEFQSHLEKFLHGDEGAEEPGEPGTGRADVVAE